MKKIVLAVFILFGFKNLFGQLVVNPGITPVQLVNTLIGPGIVISNVTVNGAPASSRGTFSCAGSCNIGFSDGIIITSGGATIAAMQNTGTGQGADFGGAGDPQLGTLTTGPTLDANVLEFDFIVGSDSLQFRYIFASDEYSDYVNSIANDVFGFFISGPGFAGAQNIALIPGTTMPVAINNVNNGYCPNGTVPSGPCNNCAYFTDNTNVNGSYPYTTAYDGLTTALTSKVAVQPCGTYHIKLAVADVQDHIFDSGVFLEANSFTACPLLSIFHGNNDVAGDTLYICPGQSIVLTSPAAPSYAWNNGSTTQSITVTQPGFYGIMIASGSCFVYSQYVTVIQDPNAIPAAVLTQSNDTIYSSVTDTIYIYSWNLNGNPVAGANQPFLNFTQSGCYTLDISNPGGCTMTSDSICISITGIHPISIGGNLILHPNPVTQSATLDFDNPYGETFAFKILDVAGRIVQQSTVISRQALIEKKNLKEGLYFFELRNTSGSKNYKGKFVIN